VVIDGQDKKVTVDSQGQTICELGSQADQRMLLGSTFRRNQTAFDNVVFQQLQLWMTAITVNLATATALNAVPIVGGALALSPLTAALIAMNTAVGTLISKLQSFDQFASTGAFVEDSDQYLSKYNKLK
jgi:hypothetical protein